MDSTTETESKPLVDWHERALHVTDLIAALRFVAEARRDVMGREYLGCELWADRVVAILMEAANGAPEVPGALPRLHLHVGGRGSGDEHAGCDEHTRWFAAPLRDGVELPASSGFGRIAPELDLRSGNWKMAWVLPGERGVLGGRPVEINGIGYALELGGLIVGRTDLRDEAFVVLRSAGDAFEVNCGPYVHAQLV